MGSRYGERHDLPGYDRFRTGLTYDDVRKMMWDESEDRADWKYKRRGTVLGRWHQLKLEMYNQAVDAGMDPSRPNEGPGDGRCQSTPRIAEDLPEPRMLRPVLTVGRPQRPRRKLGRKAPVRPAPPEPQRPEGKSHPVPKRREAAELPRNRRKAPF